MLSRDYNLFCYLGNPYGFAGMRYDGEIGLYHTLYRAYDPDLGRWIEVDPIGYIDGMNLYEYVKDNPVNYKDFYGLFCGCIVKRAKSESVVGGSIKINAGHEWITCSGDSIGFWPNRGWEVISPDPAEEAGVPAYITWETSQDKGWFGEKKLKWGVGAGKKCCQATCNDITSCVMSSPNPGWRSCSITNNCRRFVEETLKNCCLKKSKKTVN